MNTFSLKSYHAEATQHILQELERFFDEEIKKAGEKDQVLVDMVRVLKEFMLRGGKRIRPFLTVLGYEYGKQLGNTTEKHSSQSNNSANIFRLAAAVEVHHQYILNLDDMADRDVLRHGGPTLETYYAKEVFADWPDAAHHGQSFSSIAGALLNSFTFELLASSGFDGEKNRRILQVITDQLFSDTVVGWQIHYFQNNEKLSQASEERFIKGLDFVTSRYTFTGPLRIGLLAAGLDEQSNASVFRAFQAFGRTVGTAFQIQDDIIGLFGDPKVTGKAVGNDVREGKKTLLMQFAYRHSGKKDQEFLENVCGRQLQVGELERVQQIVKNTGSLSYSQQLAKEKVGEGMKTLKALSPSTQELYILEELAEYVIQRVS